MPCAQFMNFTISWPSRWPIETGMVARPSRSCGEQQQQDRDVAEGRRGADARIEQPPMRQQRDADQAEDAGNTADDDRHQLLEAVA